MAENALVAKFETAYGMVELTPEIVTKYLKRGNTDLTDQEIRLFIELCKFQKLNPFVGEAYPIKFGNDFQMVIGYDTYKRRAEENPSYRGRKSGIVVVRGDQVIQKEGTCLYPKEALIGGWCRVFRELPNGKEDETYKEVALSEYQKMKDGRPAANWGTKPATMIEKVAVSQALRAAFPKDYTGLYTEEELPIQATETTDGSAGGRVDVTGTAGEPRTVSDPGETITREQRKEMIDAAVSAYGTAKGVEAIKAMCAEYGFQSSQEVTPQAFAEIMTKLNSVIDQKLAAEQGGEDYSVK